MAFTANGHIALSATGQLHGPTRLHQRNGRLVKFCNGELMGEKLKFAPIQTRKKANAIVTRICNTLTADLSGETKVSFLVFHSSNTRNPQAPHYIAKRLEKKL